MKCPEQMEDCDWLNPLSLRHKGKDQKTKMLSVLHWTIRYLTVTSMGLPHRTRGHPQASWEARQLCRPQAWALPPWKGSHWPKVCPALHCALRTRGPPAVTSGSCVSQGMIGTWVRAWGLPLPRVLWAKLHVQPGQARVVLWAPECLVHTASSHLPVLWTSGLHPRRNMTTKQLTDAPGSWWEVFRECLRNEWTPGCLHHVEATWPI